MLAPNTLLQNRYLIVRLLAQGGMGAIYEASDQRLGNTVALKETFFSDETLRHAFEREARLLARLRHPALPVVSDHFVEGNGQFLVMQFIPGNDLEQMLRHRGAPFPQNDVLVWADQLLDALDYLHTQEPPIIHRDIKPQNLKLTDRGQIILLDFGLAKGSPSQGTLATGGRSIFGYTPDYAPLEQIKAEGTDARSDLYSLAATLYTLLTGVTTPGALTRITAVASSQPDPLRPANEINPTLKPSVASVLMWAMAHDRNHRPASAAAMRQALGDAARAATFPGAQQRTISNEPTTLASQPARASQPVAPPLTQQPNWPAAPQPAMQPGWPQQQQPSMPRPYYAQPARASKAGWWVAGSLAALLLVAVIGIAVYIYNSNQSADERAAIKVDESGKAGARALQPPNTNAPPPNELASSGPVSGEEDIDRILDRYVEAVGGREAIESVTTRVAKGTFELPDLGVSGETEIYAKAPNKLLVVINLPGVGVSRTGYNGSTGWSQDQQTGLRKLSGNELISMKRDSDFYRDVRLKEIYSSLSFTGKDTINGRETYVVEAVPPEGGSEKMYFDAKTGLIIRDDAVREGLQGMTSTESYFENFKSVDGINIPFTLRQQSALVKVVIKLREVRHNVLLNDSIFNTP